MTNIRLLKAALTYASKGWHIFPVTPDQKTPYGSLVHKGHLDATTNSDQITKWWTKAPKANIGLNLEASCLVCIDVDSYKPDCGFDDFIKDKHLPQTLTQKSASGGTHYIFKANPESTFPGTLCKGILMRNIAYHRNFHSNCMQSVRTCAEQHCSNGTKPCLKETMVTTDKNQIKPPNIVTRFVTVR